MSATQKPIGEFRRACSTRATPYLLVCRALSLGAILAIGLACGEASDPEPKPGDSGGSAGTGGATSGGGGISSTGGTPGGGGIAAGGSSGAGGSVSGGGSGGTGGQGATCKDGKKNGNETGIDCGGSCPACPSCKDGKKNGNETGIDCGGSCPACSTCKDGKKNGNEIGIDCGGSCIYCPQQCPTGEPALPGDNWLKFPDPANPCAVPYTHGKTACPSLKASVDNCLAVPMLGGSHDPKRDCLIRKIRQQGKFETQIANCLKPSYSQTCMVNLAYSAGAPKTCP